MTEPAAPATAGTYQGKTAEQYRTEATTARRLSAESFERCDSDGFLSQWANDLGARELELKAKIAEAGGTVDTDALFLTDGRLASTHQAEGEWGWYWVLNDAAAAVYGKRFFTPSKALKGATRRANNAKKGFTVGTVRVAAHVTLAGAGTGLAGAASVRPVARPDLKALKAGQFEVIGTDTDTTDY